VRGDRVSVRLMADALSVDIRCDESSYGPMV